MTADKDTQSPSKGIQSLLTSEITIDEIMRNKADGKCEGIHNIPQAV